MPILIKERKRKKEKKEDKTFTILKEFIIR